MKSLRNKDLIRTLLLHVIVWFLYVTIVFSINLLANHLTSYYKTVLYLIPYLVIFYITIYCLQLYEKRGLFWATAFFLSFLFLEGGAGYVYIYQILPRYGIQLFSSTEIKSFLHEILLNYFHFSTLAILYYYIQKTIRTGERLVVIQNEKLLIEKQKFRKDLENENLKRKELDAQKEKIQYEYALLKAQINPHFLHNTLNVLFSQAIDYSDELANNILKLSRMMRYSIESLEVVNGKVSIESELDHLQTLLDIHKLRFDESNFIEYTIEGGVQGQLLPPLSIVTIVENSFKYGDLKDPEYPLKIKIKLLPNEIYFWCCNKKKEKITQLSSFNIGLKNLKRRLEVYFENKYSLEIIENSNVFTVFMQIRN